MRRLVSLLLALALGAVVVVPVSGGQPCDRDHTTCQPGSVAMGRLLTAGAETNDATLEGLSITTATTSTTRPRSGTRSFDFSGGLGAVDYALAGVVGTTYYARGYFYLNSFPTSGNMSVLSVVSGATVIGTIRVDLSGNIGLYQGNTTLIGSTTTVGLNTWYRIELGHTIAVGAADYLELRLDGVSVASSSTLNITDSAATKLTWAVAASGAGGFADDLAVNDSAGANQNSWPGDGAAVLLLPTADSARGTGWVNDANAASGFFDATNNTPPQGIAQTTASTGLHQIQNATSNANSNVDLTMTDYTTAGVPAGATVNLVDPIIATGAPVSTGAKAGTVGVVSNPAIANVALGAGGTAGAFWSGTAAGTYNSGWKISHGTTTYAPSVTLGTAPVMRVTQVTSSTRIALVCFMGIYVDYTPAVVTANPRPILQVRQAVGRSTL